MRNKEKLWGSWKRY